MPRPARPSGTATRGTTNPNRLRRVDRYLTGPLAGSLRSAGPAPTVVDLGYGARPFTAVELLERVQRVRPDARVVGVEIDPARVAEAKPLESESLRFLHGGFEVPLPVGWGAPTIIRAMNVLRQYPEAGVAGAWAQMTSRLAPGGWLVEGTCDEIGRLASWVTVGRAGPERLTISLRLAGLERPSDVAARLPKCLIHHNVPGQPIHRLLTDLDHAWDVHAPLRVHGATQRWLAAVAHVRDTWQVADRAPRWRLGEITVPWELVRPQERPPVGRS